MAISYQDVQTVNSWGTGVSSINIPKPTGLQEGDLMIAHIATYTDTLTAKTGWYSLAGVVDSMTIISDGVTPIYSGVQYKIADSSDVAASNFTFSKNVADNGMAGAIHLIRGQNLTTTIATYNSAVATNSANPSLSNTITPSVANSLLLMLVTVGTSASNGTPNTSGYSVATDNPSWTERYDVTADAGGLDPVLAAATATRSQTTATGNSTFTTGSASADSICFLIAISPEPDPVLTPSSINLVATIPTQGFSVSASIGNTSINLIATINNPVLSSVDNPWTNQDKNPSSWTNEDKS